MNLYIEKIIIETIIFISKNKLLPLLVLYPLLVQTLLSWLFNKKWLPSLTKN